MARQLKIGMFACLLVAIGFFFGDLLKKRLWGGSQQSQSASEHKLSPNIIYTKLKNGIAHFSDKNSEDAKIYQPKNPVQYIPAHQSNPIENEDNLDAMSTDKAELAKSNNKHKNKSKLQAVLDPINSINSEAEKKVKKMRKVEREKQAKQGI